MILKKIKSILNTEIKIYEILLFLFALGSVTTLSPYLFTPYKVSKYFIKSNNFKLEEEIGKVKKVALISSASSLLISSNSLSHAKYEFRAIGEKAEGIVIVYLERNPSKDWDVKHAFYRTEKFKVISLK